MRENRGSSRMTKLLEETITRSIIGAFFDVYNTLGYGFLEPLYVLAMEQELIARATRCPDK